MNCLRYPERYISYGRREILCQILNWSEGPPPKYLVCHPLDAEITQEFVASQRNGAWMHAPLQEVIGDLQGANRKMEEGPDNG